MKRLTARAPYALSGANKTFGQASRHSAMPRALRSLAALPDFATRSLLLSALSCALLTGAALGSRAEDTAKTDKADKTAETKEQPKTADAKTDAPTVGDSKSQDKPADKSTPKTKDAPDKTPAGDKAAAPVKYKSLLTPLLIARLQDAAKQDAGGAAQTTPPQTNPPQTSTPPQKPSEGQPAQTPAAPAAPAATPPGTITYSGLLDVYYGFNARAPRATAAGPFGGAFTGITTPSGEHIGIDNAGRSFDINDREASFNLGEFNITRTEGRGFPLGFTATLTVGDTARIVHGTEPGGTGAWQTIQQLYVTKTPHFLGRDLTFDAGIFVSPLGLEVIESTSNDNYSRSFGFQYAVPFYHAGLRLTVPITPKLQLLAAGVNGWNNIADDNDDKSALFQLTWKPSTTFTGIVGFIGGGEGTGAYGPGLAPKNTSSIDTYVYEVQGIYQVTPALKLAGIVDYGTGSGHAATGIPGGSSSAQGHVSGTWLSLAGYARYQFNTRLALAARIEQFDDNAGAGGVGLRTGGTGYNRLREGTVTLEYTFFRSHLVTRLEYRHDASNQSFFGAGGGTSRDQDTAYASAAYKF